LDQNKEVDPHSLEWFEGSAVALTQTISDFKFLPVFLIGLFVNRETTRWLQWIDVSFTVQGRIHDIALALAGAFPGTNDPKSGDQQRATQYKFYRYLNVLHYLVYFGLDPRIGSDARTVCQELVTVELLTEEEGAKLFASHPKMRDTMLAWISVLWQEEVHAGTVRGEMDTVFMGTLMKLRGMAATPLCIEDVRPPSIINVMLRVVTGILLFMVIFGYPLSTHVNQSCIQWWAILQTYLFTICYVGMLFVMGALAKNPLHPHADCINIDVLLCDCENMIFHAIRASYQPLLPTKQCSIRSIPSETPDLVPLSAPLGRAGKCEAPFHPSVVATAL